MVNPDDCLEMAMARYVDAIWRLDLAQPSRAERRERRVPSALPVRLALAGLLRRLADLILAEPEAASADLVVAARRVG